MLVIVVLPDVDLLDTAFQRGTSPVAVHAQAISGPSTVNLPTVLQLPQHSFEAFRHWPRKECLFVFSVPNFLPIVLCSLRR
jgi:hypothetical protein